MILNQMSSMAIYAGLFLAYIPLSSAMFYYPSVRYAVAERLIVDINGFNADNMDLPLMIKPGGCNINPNNSGESKPAEWVRTLFHDSASYDASLGLYGVDGSVAIHVEQARPENGGVAIPATTQGAAARCCQGALTMADCLVMGLVAATAQCGNLSVPLRLGRKDATTPNPAGVPEPQDPTSLLISKFAKMGFTLEESITAVACGHSLGSVHSKGPPGNDIVSSSHITPNDTTGAKFFDETPTVLDQGNVMDYVHRTGGLGGPLVVPELNATVMNSDARLFSSDNNHTMMGLAAMNEEDFKKKCSHIFEKMVNLVPRDVELSEIIKPLPIKPTNTTFDLTAKGDLMFGTSVRLLSKQDNFPGQINFQYLSEDNKQITLITEFNETLTGNSLSAFGFSAYYPFTINFEHGTASKFRSFTITAQGFQTQSYEVQSDFFLVPSLSNLTMTGNGTATLNIVAASSSTASDVVATVNIPTPMNGTDTPTNVKTRLNLRTSGVLGQYKLYAGSMKNVSTKLLTLATVDVTAEVGFQSITDPYNQLAFLPLLK